MKKIITIAVTLFILCANAQNKITGFTSTNSNPTSTDKLINEGNFTDEEGKVIKSFVLIFDGNLSVLTNNLTFYLGNIDVIRNHVDTKLMFFRKFKKPEWSDNKMTMMLSTGSFGNRHMVTITCVDSKKTDLLVPGTETEGKIKKYLEDVLAGR